MAEVQIIGAGGHAKVIVALAKAAGYRIAGIYDDRPTPDVLGHKVSGPVELVSRVRHIPAIIAVGSNSVRASLVARLPDVPWATLVHPTAWVAPTVSLAEGTVVMAGAIVQPDVTVGRHVIVNTGATVDHDSHLGDFVHVAPGCTLAGQVSLEEGAFLGVGARILPRQFVGAWATIGAGAVVNREVPAYATAVGVPARLLRM
ncbi:acetyltransferase [Deinococcus sp. MIMF12]|uniref:Acetyltransferase n=1 Tax=Deinococcus rhizophilus TaxID=3049544 RepID=A0ABT7JET2_9DEIO|nr:acetyltransferase [Deinococcus rhizophilus]MDL2342995.1 acetyltransferase [Deinococcus rhizophilus]